MKLLSVFVVLVSIQGASSQGHVNPLKKTLNKNKETLNPAVTVQLTERAINYAASIAAEKIARDVEKTQIDDISGKKVVHYSVENIKINHFNKPDSQISMIPGHGIHIKLVNGALSASARWSYSKAFVRDSGSVKASVGSINIAISVNILSDSNGRPRLNGHDCSVNLGGFNVKLHGGASIIYNLVLKHIALQSSNVRRAFKGKIRSSIERSICNAATNAFNNKGNEQLGTLNLQAKLSEGLVLDYFLTGPPTFAGTYFETSHKGMFLEDPETPKIPLIGTPSSGMVGFSIADEAFNSAARVAFAKNLLSREFDVDAIKSFLAHLDPRFLESKFIATIMPSAAPRVDISLNALSISVSAQAVLVGRMPDGSTIDVLTVDLSLSASTTLSIVEEKIVIQVTQIVPKADVKITHIGEVSTDFLNALLDEIVKFVLPLINESLQKGFPLPNVDRVKFPNAIISLHPGYLSVSTDVVYQP